MKFSAENSDSRSRLAQLLRRGEPLVWLNAGAVSFSILAVVGLLGLLAWHGLGYFWPRDIGLYEYRVQAIPGQVLGEAVASEAVSANQLSTTGGRTQAKAEAARQWLIKRGNRDVMETDFVWLLEPHITNVSYPAAALRIEREEWGNVYGTLEAVLEDGRVIADSDDTPDLAWTYFQRRIATSRAVHDEIKQLERGQINRISRELERLQRKTRRRQLSDDVEQSSESALQQTRLEARYEATLDRLTELYDENERASYRLRLADGRVLTLPVSQVVRAIAPNRMSVLEKLNYFRIRVWEFVSTGPREANTEGGVYPAIFGTVLMVLLMSVIVTPFGVLAAVFLHEVAGQGSITRIFRAAVNNLAGVPSIVYGIFGLGFFVYGVGGEMDRLFFAESLPNPTYGTPGIMWASLTLALLTLPVVIVATEEGLARIPRSVREGSLALGATRAETLWRVVLPMASPAMMTGVILAVARAAGEVAPLMLVGVVKLAPSLPLDGVFPYLHLEQKFMHLGFHIYDVGFQSPNIEAARPLVYATSLLLVIIIALLNLAAVTLRNRLRERYVSLDAS